MKKPLKHYIRLNLLLLFGPIVLNFILYGIKVQTEFIFGGFISLLGLIGLIANLWTYNKTKKLD
jgi:hypothetical protein